MSNTTIFSPFQQSFFAFFQTQKQLTERFYFTGGTCLTEYYLHHRYSEDLDFFSENEFDPQDITLLLTSHKHKLDNPTIDYQQSFNRNIYQLKRKKDILKVEFTYYPFKRIQKKRVGSLQIDSITDIAVNKLFTIYQNPRGRDYYDLYMILQKDTTLSFTKCISLARIKFDFPIDYLQLGTQFMKIAKLKDDPILRKKIEKNKVEEFFLGEAKKLKEKIVK